MKKLFVALLVLLFTWGCHRDDVHVQHPRDPYARTLRVPTYIDRHFDRAQRAEIETALDTWNYTLNGTQKFYVADDDWDPGQTYWGEFVDNERDGLMFVKVLGDHGGTLGWVPELGDDHVFLVTDTCEKWADLHSVAAHEVGHALGIPHVQVKGALLYPYYTHQGVPEDGRCVDEFTARALSEAHPDRFPVEHLSYCRLP